ncbi:MAG TPA: SpoIID/LytB domain-containing protein, partial [Deinococcales bacterium]|nr:SpoIID/LytB domain-containing protein [Deinococcales bacterium]
MPLKRTILLLLLMLLPLAAAQVPVRVLLAEVPGLTVQFDGWHRGFVDGEARFETELPLSWPLRAEDGTIIIDGEPAGRTLRLETASGFVQYDGTTYRGALAFTARGSDLLVLNAVDVEDYLRGVVPAEMQAVWPAEALRAQAIAARSYVLSSLDYEADYDVCATQDCQVYDGTTREHPATDAAVAATAGTVLTWEGTFARTYYHADSGGAVASSEEVWGEDRPYLPALTDVAADTPHRSWSVDIAAARLAAELNASGLAVGTPHGLEVLERTRSGRAARVRISGSSGSTV